MEKVGTIGHNLPPSAIESAKEALQALTAWMKDHPVIMSEDEAREAKPHLDRVVLSFKDMEDERHALVRPLNEEVAKINSNYHAVHNESVARPAYGDKIVSEMKARLTAYAREEERKRVQAAQEAARKAEEARQKALEAERVEMEAKENASLGEAVDTAQATMEADKAFADFQREQRFADRAERDSKVRIAGGFGRSLALKRKEILTVTDVHGALKMLWPNDGIRDAVLSAARAYRKVFGDLPDGIAREESREI